MLRGHPRSQLDACRKKIERSNTICSFVLSIAPAAFSASTTAALFAAAALCAFNSASFAGRVHQSQTP
eukprot:2555579-Prymnesium_polylepis.1